MYHALPTRLPIQLASVAPLSAAVLLLGFGVTARGASGNAQAPGQSRPATPIPPREPEFKTGFEPGEATARPADEVYWLDFQNTSRLSQARPWSMSVYYETPGDVGDRYARIVDDPAGGSNKVLQFWLRNAVVDAAPPRHTKGRVQSGFGASLDDLVEIHSTQRMFLGSDLELMHEYPADGDRWWLGVILGELWSGAPWLGDPNPSRITLSMFSLQGAMHLGIRCQAGETGAMVWEHLNATYELPVAEWLTMEMGYRMGDASSGRLVLIVTRESTGAREVVFDVRDWTYDPAADSPGGPGPRPVTHWNPQKLYTSDNVIDHIRDHGGVAQVYWDDFSYSRHWPLSWP